MAKMSKISDIISTHGDIYVGDIFVWSSRAIPINPTHVAFLCYDIDSDEYFFADEVDKDMGYDPAYVLSYGMKIGNVNEYYDYADSLNAQDPSESFRIDKKRVDPKIVESWVHAYWRGVDD